MVLMAPNKPIKIDLEKLLDWARRSGRTYGIRHCSPAAVGDKLAPSCVWEDGYTTEEMLDGTCAISLEHAKEHVGYKKFGPAHLVIGRPSLDYAAEDFGEVVLRDCVVVAILDI
jgi:hypothetical protein